ncbi:MAG TPA: hypothetical protein VES61_06095 [Gaiellaceae bacterium]|nr:hypothetical protein [Gaiellaceae bacterium]
MSFAFAAIAAPTAQARIHWNSGTGLESQVTSVRPDDRAVRGVPQSANTIKAWPGVRPDDKAIRFSPQSDVTAVVRPDDRAARFSPHTGSESLNLWRNPAAVTGNDGLVLRRNPGAVVENPVVATGGNSFDWSDAGIGAAIMLGFLLLATGAATLGRQSRKSLAGA